MNLENFKNKNLLIWPRAAGIGDLVSILAEGMVVFNEKPFNLIISKQSLEMKIYEKKYEKDYKDICKAFILCENLVIMDFKSDNELDEYIFQKFNNDNIHYVRDWGWKNSKENTKYIQNNLYKYFNFRNDILLDKKSKYKLTICFNIKNTINNPRSIDLDKWIKVIKYIAENNKNILLIGIGTEDKNSANCLNNNKLKKLLDFKNIVFSFFKITNKTVIDDISIIYNSDLFLGGQSGPSFIAYMLKKPCVLFFPYCSRKSILEAQPDLLEYQKVFFGTYTSEEMQDFFNYYMNNIFFKKDLNNEKMNNLKSKKLNYNVYYKLGLKALENKLLEKADKFFEKSNDYIDLKDEYQFYKIARLYKDYKNNKQAIKYFRKALDWAKGDKRWDIFSASNFHLGEIFLAENNKKYAKKYFIECLKYNPNHSKAKEFLVNC